MTEVRVTKQGAFVALTPEMVEVQVQRQAAFVVLQPDMFEAQLLRQTAFVALNVLLPIHPEIGDVLTYSVGGWENSPTGFNHQWLRDGVDIPGATGATYVVVASDEASKISLRISGVNANGEGPSYTTEETYPVRP